jgi:hypothetical protein
MATDVKLISRTYSDRIVNDLLKKYPKGPKGLLKKEHYVNHEDYDYRSRRYKKYLTLPEGLWCTYGNHASFGYEVELLCMVQHHINAAGGTRPYLQRIDSDAGGTAITRRANRIDRRVGKASRRFLDAGGRGIYRVDNESSVNLYVIANSDKSAQFLARTMLATSGIIQKRNMYTRKVAVSSTEILKAFMDKSSKTAMIRVKSYKEEIEKKQARIIALNHLAEAIGDFGNIQSDMLSEGG